MRRCGCPRHTLVTLGCASTERTRAHVACARHVTQQSQTALLRAWRRSAAGERCAACVGTPSAAPCYAAHARLRCMMRRRLLCAAAAQPAASANDERCLCQRLPETQRTQASVRAIQSKERDMRERTQHRRACERAIARTEPLRQCRAREVWVRNPSSAALSPEEAETRAHEPRCERSGKPVERGHVMRGLRLWW